MGASIGIGHVVRIGDEAFAIAYKVEFLGTVENDNWVGNGAPEWCAEHGERHVIAHAGDIGYISARDAQRVVQYPRMKCCVAVYKTPEDVYRHQYIAPPWKIGSARSDEIRVVEACKADILPKDPHGVLKYCADFIRRSSGFDVSEEAECAINGLIGYSLEDVCGIAKQLTPFRSVEMIVGSSCVDRETISSLNDDINSYGLADGGRGYGSVKTFKIIPSYREAAMEDNLVGFHLKFVFDPPYTCDMLPAPPGVRDVVQYVLDNSSGMEEILGVAEYLKAYYDRIEPYDSQNKKWLEDTNGAISLIY